MVRCEICQNCYFDSVDKLKVHFATQHLTSAVYMMVVLVHPNPEKANLRSKHLKCLFCLTKFSDFEDLRGHLKMVHPELNFPDDPPCVSEMFCLQCVEKFPTHPQLASHFKVVHNLSKCPCPCELPIGDTDMTRAYREYLFDSPFNYNKDHVYRNTDPRKDGKPKYRAPSVRELLKRKRAKERGEEVLEDDEKDASEDDDYDEALLDAALDDETGDCNEGDAMNGEAEEDVEVEVEAIEEPGIQTFRPECKYESIRTYWICACCKKEFQTKVRLTHHMRAPDHEQSLTYILSVYKYGTLTSCLSRSIRLIGKAHLSKEEDDKRHISKSGAGLGDYRCPRCDEAFFQDVDVENHLKESDCLGIPVDAKKGAIEHRRNYSAIATCVSTTAASTSTLSTSVVCPVAEETTANSSSDWISSTCERDGLQSSISNEEKSARPAITTYTRRKHRNPNATFGSSTTSNANLLPPPAKTQKMTLILSPEDGSDVKLAQEIKIEIEDDVHIGSSVNSGCGIFSTSGVKVELD